jgi:hypothetical protein
MVTDQYLSVFEFRQCHLNHFEVLRSGFALRAVIEDDAVVQGHGDILQCEKSKQSIGWQTASWPGIAASHVFESASGMGTQLPFSVVNSALCESHAARAMQQ